MNPTASSLARDRRFSPSSHRENDQDDAEELEVADPNDMGSTPPSPERDDAIRDGHQDTMDAVEVPAESPNERV